MSEILQWYEAAKLIENKHEKIRQLKLIRIAILKILINPDLSSVEKTEAKKLSDLILFSLN